MVKFTLRIDDDRLVAQFDELARDHGMTRTAFIVQLIEDAVNAGYVPMREGEGFHAITMSGGEISLKRHSNYVSGGMSGLDEAQKAAFERAKELAGPEYGSQWIEARKILEDVGFRVFKL
jgi:hypothetical protein